MADSTGPGHTPNFFCEYSVLLDHPVDRVFAVLGTTEGHERTCRLSSLCTAFELTEKDAVALQPGASLADSHVRTIPASESEAGLPRQHFKMTETVPVLFGFTNAVHLVGTLTWDEQNRMALYETVASGSGILVWKLRAFEEVEGKTRVTETIKGRAPMLLRGIVQRGATDAHKKHMELYRTLF